MAGSTIALIVAYLWLMLMSVLLALHFFWHGK